MEDQNEERLYHCAECGEAAELGAFDDEDGEWYCKGCWEAFMADEEPGDAAQPAASPQPRSSGVDEGTGYSGPVDEDAEGVGIVISNVHGSGFCVSQEGLVLLRGRGKEYSAEAGGKDVPRVDPDLVALVREDADRMSGEGTSLTVRRIPREAYDSEAYRIHNFDGKELLAIDPEAYRAQAQELRELRGRAEEQGGEWPQLKKLLAAMLHVLYQPGQSDEERLSILRQLAPAAVLEGSVRPAEALGVLAESADRLFGAEGNEG